MISFKVNVSCNVLSDAFPRTLQLKYVFYLKYGRVLKFYAREETKLIVEGKYAKRGEISH